MLSSSGYGPRVNRLATDGKLFANIPQLRTEKDWPVWKFQVTHALKASEQWEFATGAADAGADGYARESLLLYPAVHWPEERASCDELQDS